MTRLPREVRRQQLLDTAVTLFAERGFSGATTAELAKAAGVTEPIIYRHFSSKKDLFIAVIENTSDATLAQWEKVLKSAPDPARRLRRLLAANPMVSNKGEGIYRVIVQAMMEINDPDILSALQIHIRKIHAFVVAEVEQAQTNGQVSKAFSPEITAWALLHMALGFGIMAPIKIDGHAMDVKGVRVRDLVQFLILGERAKQVQDKLLRGGPSGGDSLEETVY
ncbi:MAG: TetR/AcrR family transcriptional regulator [Planctomycetota bacterium]